MKFSNRLLILAVAILPFAAFAPEGLMRQLIAALAALALLAICFEAPPGLMRHLTRLLLPWAVSFACFAAFLLMQMLPVPNSAFAHPIWGVAAPALSRPLWGHVTIDLGATLLSLEAFTGCFAIGATAAAIAIERLRAQRAMLWLAGACAVAALALIASQRLGLARLGAPPTGGQSAQLIAASGFGLIANLALIFHFAESSSSAGERAAAPRRWLRLAISAVCALVCLAAVVTSVSPFVVAAVGYGLLGLIVVLIIRWLGLSFWPAALTVTCAVAIAVISIAHGFATTSGALPWRFATLADGASAAVGERALADVGWIGDGAGASTAILSAYRDFGAPALIRPPTTAAEAMIGLGKPASAILLIWALGAAIFLFGSALGRGRDWIYLAAAAAWILTLTAGAFTDLSLTTPVASALTAVALGLGVGQSVSRSASNPE